MTVVSLASRRTAASVFSASVSEFASSRLALLAWLPSTPRLAVRSNPGPPAASRKPAERSACCELGRVSRSSSVPAAAWAVGAVVRTAYG